MPARRSSQSPTPTKQTSKARVLSSRTVFRGKVFSVTTDDVIEPNGVHARRDIVRHQGSVVVLPVDTTGSEPRVLLIRQYRYAPDQMMWEIPAGRIDDGEQPLEAGKRELVEETGFAARKWKRALSFYASPGFMNEIMHVLLAEHLTSGTATPEEDERISKRFFPLPTVVNMINTGKIRDGKTIAAVLWYAQEHC